MNSVNTTFAHEMRRIAANQGLSLHGVAKASGVAYSNVQRIASGKGCTLATADKIAKALGSTLADMVR